MSKAQVKSTLSPSKDTTIIVEAIQPEPSFPGGEKAFKKFLAKNLKWPKDSPDTQGKVFIYFIVQKDGRLTNFKMLRGIWPSVDAEVMRVMKKSPKWIPAMENGKPFKSSFTVVVPFYLSE